MYSVRVLKYDTAAALNGDTSLTDYVKELDCDNLSWMTFSVSLPLNEQVNAQSAVNAEVTTIDDFSNTNDYFGTFDDTKQNSEDILGITAAALAFSLFFFIATVYFGVVNSERSEWVAMKEVSQSRTWSSVFLFIIALHAYVAFERYLTEVRSFVLLTTLELM